MYIHIQQLKQEGHVQSLIGETGVQLDALLKPVLSSELVTGHAWGMKVPYGRHLLLIIITSIAQIKQLEAGSQIPLFELRLEARNKTTLKDTATGAAELVT